MIAGGFSELAMPAPPSRQRANIEKTGGSTAFPSAVAWVPTAYWPWPAACCLIFPDSHSARVIPLKLLIALRERRVGNFADGNAVLPIRRADRDVARIPSQPAAEFRIADCHQTSRSEERR